MENYTPDNRNLEQITLADMHEGLKRFIEKVPIKIDENSAKRSLHLNHTEYTFFLTTSEGECVILICYDGKKDYIVKYPDGTLKTGRYII